MLQKANANNNHRTERLKKYRWRELYCLSTESTKKLTHTTFSLLPKKVTLCFLAEQFRWLLFSISTCKARGKVEVESE